MHKLTNDRMKWGYIAILAAMVVAGYRILSLKPIDGTQAVKIATRAMAAREVAPSHPLRGTARWSRLQILAIRITGYGPDGSPRCTAQSTRFITTNRFGFVVA